MRKLAVAALAVSALLGGCDNEGTITTVIDGSGDRPPMWIYGGSAPDSPEHGATVGVHQLTSSSVYIDPFCSGVMIRDDAALTAAHCCDNETRWWRPNFVTMSPDEAAIYVGDDPSADILDHL